LGFASASEKATGGVEAIVPIDAHSGRGFGGRTPARKLPRQQRRPQARSHAALAAKLTEHLVDGAVLISGAAGTLPEQQQVGFHYAT
jgi:hypothetical protein